MIRGLFILIVTLMALLAAIVGVVGVGMQRIAAAQKAADATWQPSVRVVSLVPATNPSDPPAVASEPEEEPLPQVNSIEMWAKDAVLHGNVQLSDTKAARAAKARVDAAGNDRVDEERRRRELMAGHTVTNFLTGFKDPDDSAEWTLELPKAGDYEIDLSYACAPWSAGGHFVINMAGKKLAMTADATRHELAFRVITLGKLTLPAGKTTVIFCPEGNVSDGNKSMNLRSIEIIPAS